MSVIKESSNKIGNYISRLQQVYVFPNRWNASFIPLSKIRRSPFLRSVLAKKSYSTRRPKNVPIFLKRNWIHKSVWRRRTGCTGVHLAFLRWPEEACSQGSLKAVSRVKKARVPGEYFPWASWSLWPGLLAPLDFTFSLSRLIYQARSTFPI